MALINQKIGENNKKITRIEKSSQAYIYPLIHVYRKKSSPLNYSH